MKPHILQLNPILIPAANDELASLYTVHKLFEIDDQDAWFAQYGDSIQAAVTGGHTGISRAMLERLPALKVVAVNGVGTDAVDLAYCRERKLPVTATLGALTEDVADLAIGLLIAACRNICAGDRFVRDGQWERFPQPSAIPLARRFSGMRVGIVGMGRVGRAVAVRAAAFGCHIAYTDLRAMDDVAHRFVPDLVALARCACSVVRSDWRSASGTRGSSTNTSRPAPAMLPASMACARSSSLTSRPRATLTRKPRGPSASSTAALTMPSAVSAAAHSTSASASRARSTRLGTNGCATSSMGRRSV